ncbi:MAG: dTMP kinase [Deltaproteobacteria bacterium RBG_13_61_14]|nr:MAG: dTMP kinase [Deltaproteobacteria bacterium RBG_13_61_14]
MEPGKFIVLEGIDGAGTTTQAERLAQWLRGRGLKVHLTREPSTGRVGQVIREWLAEPTLGAQVPPPALLLRDHALALLFAADRLDHLAREVEPQLAQGIHVVSDRYLLSSLAYQSLACDRDWVAEINREARPADLTTLLDLPAEQAMQRLSRRDKQPELFEKIEVQEKVRQLYLDTVRELANDQAVVVLDGSKGIEEVFQAICRTVEPILG